MFGERWQRIISTQGDATALWHPHGSYTFRELEAAARRLPLSTCPRLGAFYLAQGDGLQVATALLAAFLTGKPVQVVERDRTRRIPNCRPPRYTALVKQTVGSSGQRRCQFFSFSQITADVDRLYEVMSLRERGVAVAAISVAHSYGLTTTLLPMLLHGMPVHWLPTPFPSAVTEALTMHRRLFLPSVPAVWKAWLSAGLDLSKVTLAVSAGSPLSAQLEYQVRENLGLKLHNLYGTSEGGAISYDASEDPRPDDSCMGALLPGIQAVTDPQGRLLVKSDAVGLGYDETLPGEDFGNGRHLTWDRVNLEPTGLNYLECVGAGINVASRKLSPEEIADRIRAATGVRHIRVHGITSRDPERVQDVVACLDIPAEHLTPAFKARACQALAPWEVPRQWRIGQPSLEDRRHAAPRNEMPLNGFSEGDAIPIG
ncbi:MAG: AMP-binding protein [Prosthecobacter sp.]|nr:AMP-binding protein [Prosthecobacter sp.]